MQHHGKIKEAILCVHLLNLANMPISKKNFQDYVPPIPSIKVRVLLKEEPLEVLWEPQGEPLSWEWKDGELLTTVPVLEIHGVVMIKMKEVLNK